MDTEGQITRLLQGVSLREWDILSDVVNDCTVFAHATGFWFKIPAFLWVRLCTLTPEQAGGGFARAMVDALASGMVGKHEAAWNFETSELVFSPVEREEWKQESKRPLLPG